MDHSPDSGSRFCLTVDGLWLWLDSVALGCGCGFLGLGCGFGVSFVRSRWL